MTPDNKIGNNNSEGSSQIELNKNNVPTLEEFGVLTEVVAQNPKFLAAGKLLMHTVEDEQMMLLIEKGGKEPK